MTTITYDKPCDKNKDCKSNVCELIYDNGRPMGRFCLENTSEKYTKRCKFPKDCKSGNCVKIFDSNGHFVTKRCEKAAKLDTDTTYNAMFGNSGGRGKKSYGLVQSSAIDQKIVMDLGEEGPVAKIIMLVLNVVFDVFSIVVYDFKKCPEDDEQGIMYIIWRSIFRIIFHKALKNYGTGVFWGSIQQKYEENGKCVNESRGFDMWYIRTFITILFPPFGVFLAKGFNGFPFIFGCCFLTLLGYFPGLIYAFALINSSELEAAETALYQLDRLQKKKL